MALKDERSITILMAEDDPEDQMLVKEAFRDAHLKNPLVIVEDGEELLDYLHRRGKHADAERPDLLLLDLNMPKKDGREALEEIKDDPSLRSIPVIVLTTSGAEEDILNSYNIGVCSYIRKPVTFGKMLDVMQTMGKYWFEIVELPLNEG